jgi:hypothetical protein
VLKIKNVFQKRRVQEFPHVVHQVVVCHQVLKKKDALQGVECSSSDTSSTNWSSIAAC